MRRSSATFILWASVLGLAFACSSGDDDDNDNDNGAPTGSMTGSSTGTVTGSSSSGDVSTGGKSSTGGKASTGGKSTGGKSSTGGSEGDDDDDTAVTDDDDDSYIPPTTGAAAEACPSMEGLDSECLSQASLAEPTPVNVLIVLDKSGSMDDAGGYGQAKWQAVTSALKSALEKAQEIDNISFGLELFPQQDVEKACSNEDCCAMPDPVDAVNVDLAAASFSVPEIIGVLDETSPGGSTPTSEALDLAYNYFETGAGATSQGDKYVLLATDGGPNCNGGLDCSAEECTLNLDGYCDTGNCCADGDVTHLWCVDQEATREKIAGLAAEGIKTFVVGIPGSEQYAQWLNEFAIAGKAPADDGETSYYAVDAGGGVAALTKVFEELTVKLVHSCRIKFAEKPPSWNATLVNVAIDCTLVPMGKETVVEGSAGAGGEVVDKRNWKIDDSTDPPTVEVMGAYCDKIQDGVERLDVIVGCQRGL